jgi:hypothetical protein
MCITNLRGEAKMRVRTVRLDDEAEKALEQIIQVAGLSISGAFKRGLILLRDDLAQRAQRVPYDIYAELDLGPGSYAIAPSTDTRRGVQEAIKRKLGR